MASSTSDSNTTPAGHRRQKCADSTTSGNLTTPRPDALDTDCCSIPVEFAINYNHRNDLEKIGAAFRDQGFALTNVDADNKTVQVDFGHKCHQPHAGLSDIWSLQEFIERQTGFVTVIKGVGQVASAVAELGPPTPTTTAATTTLKPTMTSPDAPPSADGGRGQGILGIVRLSQLTNGSCFVDGSISVAADGSPGEIRRRYSLAIHEFGDLSGVGFENVGSPLVKLADRLTIEGDTGPASQRRKTIPVKEIVPECDIPMAIGKSVVLSQIFHSPESGERGEPVCAGVVARASTVGSNKKQVCSCSGKTLWEERLDQKQVFGGETKK